MEDRAIAVGRRYGGASAEERRAARRERLIRAAITLYGECGYRRTTVAAICRSAGLTPRYFYEAFDNSEALLVAAFQEVADFVIGQITAAAEFAPDDSAEGRLRALLTAYYELLRADPASARVFLSEVTDIDPRVDAMFAAAMTAFAALFARTLEPGHDGTLDPLRCAGAMHGLLAIARAWVAEGCSTPVADVVRTAEPLCRLLVGGGHPVR